MKYSLKNPKLKWVFLIVGFVIIFVFFVEINQIIVQLQQEEQKKIELWANAVSRKARFVEHTTAFFNKAAQEEQLRLQQFVKAHQIILSQPLDAELNF